MMRTSNDPKPQRRVRVAAFTDKQTQTPRTAQENVQWSVRIIDRVAAEEPDVIVLTESFNGRGVPKQLVDRCETLDGPTITTMRAKAKEHHCYLIPSIVEKRGDQLFNTSIVIDRQGEVVGQYDKTHPTDSEITEYITPGPVQPKVITTDFGKIGCQICFDANWYLDWKALADAGAEIIFFSSAYAAGRTLKAIATLFHVPIVAASTPTCCEIVDLDGLSLARQGNYRDWVIATLDLDSPLFHLDHQWDKMERIRVRYGKDIVVRVYEEEGWWRIYPQRDYIYVPEIIEEFNLVTLDEYLERSTRFQEESRANPPRLTVES